MFPLRITVRPFPPLTQPTKEPFVIMTKLGFILEIFNRLLYIIEVLMELGENQKKYHRLYENAGFVFCILNKPLFKFFCQYFLYFPVHSEKFVFTISGFSPHLFSFHSLFSPFFFCSHRRKRIQEIGKRSGDGPIAILPGVIAPHKPGLLLFPKGRGWRRQPWAGAGCSSPAV